MEIAKEMLGLESINDIPEEYEIELDKVHNMCNLAGGKLISRQVIASTINTVDMVYKAE